MYINNPGHMTKMNAMPINGKTLQKSSPELVFTDLKETWHEAWMTQVLQCDPVVTLTYFKARSTWVAYVNCKNEWVNCKNVI